ncbi:Tat pathway signal sequence domain protein [Virgifigura deserti]|uniref:Tat pathway signal sequence domain protein n=1 Tax=Virgifigura deserti TaxID=2268457 RepID=UPI003CCBD8E9
MSPFPKRAGAVTILAAALLSMCWPAVAQEEVAEAKVRVELNKLEEMGGACCAYLLFENATESAFDALKLDLVMFDPDGVIAKRLAVEGAPLPAGKTSVKLFDIQGLACAEIGQILLNDLIACQDSQGARTDCAGLLAPSSRAAVPFIK